MSQRILALDQGTSSSRAVVFSAKGEVLAVAQQELPQIFPMSGHVEHDPESIWTTQIETARSVLSETDIDTVAAIGISNQRETVILWDRDTGKPIDNAIVWQSRITEPYCESLRAAGHAEFIQQTTGLVIDPYFSASKIRHLLIKHGVTREAQQGKILAGTVDSFLLWRLTNGEVHATDVSNASRTMLMNIHTLDWDARLLDLLEVPRQMLPKICSSSEHFGETAANIFGRSIPITGIGGDQQAATFGQACFHPGMAKVTYGTGAFVLLNVGSQPIYSQHGLLTTVGWQINGKTTYCLEGSVFVAGAAVQWLRDGLGLIREASEIEGLANQCTDSGGLFFVPAFVGLGTPHWDPHARGTMVGIERSTTSAHLARATLEGIAFQVVDVMRAMQTDAECQLLSLRVDGGAAVNNTLLQLQADLLGHQVARPKSIETTALGAAYLAGLEVGVWEDLAQIECFGQMDREFQPNLNVHDRQRKQKQWSDAVCRSQSWHDSV